MIYTEKIDNPVCTGKSRKNNLSLKRKENKEKLVEEVVGMIMDDMENYEDHIRDLITEVLHKRTQKELKTYL